MRFSTFYLLFYSILSSLYVYIHILTLCFDYNTYMTKFDFFPVHKKKVFNTLSEDNE